MTNTPQHIAIIMDGNGRWAGARGRPRAFGHKAGVEAVRRTVRAAGELGVKHLTLFSFSTENWRRPPAEVSALMDLLKAYVDTDLEKLHAEGVRVHIIGGREGLSAGILEIIERAEVRTVENDDLHLYIAFNYGGRDEIARAAKRIAERVARGEVSPHEVDESLVADHLDTSGVPDPELIIRTSGEQRISNFLVWQGAYAEFVFTDTLWPDFDKAALAQAVETFSARERRFGDVTARNAN